MMLLAALCVPLWLLSDYSWRFAARHRGLTAVAWACAAFVAIVVVLRRDSWWRPPPSRGAGACATTPEEED
jgi:hypothetical protein